MSEQSAKLVKVKQNPNGNRECITNGLQANRCNLLVLLLFKTTTNASVFAHFPFQRLDVQGHRSGEHSVVIVGTP